VQGLRKEGGGMGGGGSGSGNQQPLLPAELVLHGETLRRRCNVELLVDHLLKQ